MSTAWRRAPSLIEEEVGEGLCVLRPDTNDVIVLNVTAHAVWRVLAEPATEDDVVDVLADAYGVAAEQIRSDVAQVFRELTDREFLEAVPDSAAG